MINEALLHRIWQYSLLQPGTLKTTSGEIVTIVFCGKLNKDAGPDFTEARVKIGNTLLVGNIEMHIKSSDWIKHKHQDNPAYKNIILHAVYENDIDLGLENIPVIELKNSLLPFTISQYQYLLSNPDKIACKNRHDKIKDIVKENWLDRLLAERWEQKLADWNIILDNSADDWRKLLYWRMATNFGFKVNAAPFLALAQSLPLNILARHRENLFQVEALLFGQAGMLDKNFEDEYPDKLQGEYLYLKQKYKLTPVLAHLWKFMRMRPANFPTIRIAQFAALIHKSVHLFSQIIETKDTHQIESLLDVNASEYWNNHFRFDELQNGSSVKSLGKASVQNIIINTIAPIQFLYSSRQAETNLGTQALHLLETVPAEKNAIITLWNDVGWKAENASHSQALIQLYNNYCSSKKCLDCSIGLGIIKSEN